MLTARDAIEEHARHDDDRAHLRRLYADFADAWNAVRSNITQWACHELHMPEFNDQSALWTPGGPRVAGRGLHVLVGGAGVAGGQAGGVYALAIRDVAPLRALKLQLTASCLR